MSARERYKGAAKKRSSGRFIQIPVDVLNSAAFRGLSFPAVKLMMDLNAQYKGDNNGDLSACWKFMKLCGWKSEATLNSAKKSLIASGILFETRKGARPNRASLYGLTYYALDECGGKLEVTSKSFPFNAWMLKDAPPPLRAVTIGLREGASLATPPEARKAA